MLLIKTLVLLILIFKGADAGKLCCLTPFKIQGFLSSMNTMGYGKIISGSIELLDGRRAVIRQLSSEKEMPPFGFWSARLKKDGITWFKDTGNTGKDKSLDLLGDYRNNVLLAINTTQNKCHRYMPIEHTAHDALIMLPEPHRWKDVAWIGVYDWGYKFLVAHAWIQNPNRTTPGVMDKFTECLQNTQTKLNGDPEFCSIELKECTDHTIDCADDEKKYCYYPCEITKADGDKIKRCGKDRRDDKELFGCNGATEERLATENCD